MTSARRQQYCNGIAPYEVRGRKTTCRKYAASINRKELAAADSVIDIYNRRCSAIRTEKGRGTITEKFSNKNDDATIEKIAESIGTSKEDTAEIIRCGMQNMQFVEYYRQYADEDSEESREEVAHDGSSEPDKIFFNLERIEAIMTAFEKLNYRERAMVSAHLGF